MATFGVFVATTLTITDIYIDSYHVSVKNAGLLATIFTFSTSLVRMAGGKLADRFGARQVVRISLMAVTAALIPVAFSIPLTATVILVFIAGLAMGTGMAGTFRYIPDYFPDSVGAVGGVVGALGGLGGFFLPQIGAAAKAFFGESNVQVIPLALLAAVAAVTQYLAIGRQKNGGPDGSADVRVSLTALESAVRNTTAPRVPASVGKT